MVIALRSHHPLANQESIRLSDLSEEPWIWSARSFQPRLHDEWLSLCRQAGFEPRIVETTPGQPHTMISLIEAGVGVALVSEWTQRRLAAPGVVYRPLLDLSYSVELHLLWRKDERSPLVQQFLQIAREVSAMRGGVSGECPEMPV